MLLVFVAGLFVFYKFYFIIYIIFILIITTMIVGSPAPLAPMIIPGSHNSTHVLNFHVVLFSFIANESYFVQVFVFVLVVVVVVVVLVMKRR